MADDAPTIVQDMRFTGDPEGQPPSMPDLLSDLNIIRDNYKLVPSQYHYMAPVYISHKRETRSVALFNDIQLTEDEWDALPFHIFTMMNGLAVVYKPTQVFFKVGNVNGTREA